MACISVRRGRYVVAYRDAFGRQRCPSFPKSRQGKAAADRELARVLRQSGRAVVRGVDPGITVRDYFHEWLALRRGALAAGTVASYGRIFVTHVPIALAGLRIGDVRRAHIRQLVTDRIRAGLKHSTVTLILGVLGTLFAAAVADDLVEANPAAGAARALGLKRTRPREAPTLGQLTTLLEASRGLEALPALATLAWAGLRLGELHGLREEDLDFAGRQIHVERQVYGTGDVAQLKTLSGRRAVDMAAGLEALLRRHLAARREALLAAGQPAHPWLFLPPPPWSRTVVETERARLRRELWAIAARAGLPRFRLHDLRHAFATLLLEQGADIHYVQRQLGHASIAVTVDVYGAHAKRRDPAAVDRLAERSGGAQLDLPGQGAIVGFKR